MADEIYEFGSFVFDGRRKLLLKHGEPVAVGRRGLALLKVLLESRGRTVAKPVLMDAVWPSLNVEESNLSVQVASLRKCLGKSKSGDEWIATIQGVGYQFIQEVAAAPQSSGSDVQSTLLAETGKPSIAVLPFENMSGDIEQEYFADGIVEEITTALSRLPHLFVIARNSSFSYKGRAVDVRQVGRELGIRYVLQGSVRRSSTSVRVTGQLIDCSTGAQIWAERFEGELSDVFQLQDEVAMKVAGAIAPKLERAEIRRAEGKPTRDLGAYDWYLRGMAAFHKFTKEANGEALKLFRRATDLDGNFAPAYGMAARCYMQSIRNGWVRDSAQEIAEAERLARRAEEFGMDDSEALSSIGLVFGALIGDFEHGAALTSRALALNPNSAWAWLSSSFINIYTGDPEAAIEHAAYAMRLSPQDPQKFAMQTAMALGHFFAGHNDQAMMWADAALVERPNFVAALCVAAASHAFAHNTPKSDKAVAQLRKTQHALTFSSFNRIIPLRRAEDVTRWEAGLRLAGWQDCAD